MSSWPVIDCLKVSSFGLALFETLGSFSIVFGVGTDISPCVELPFTLTYVSCKSTPAPLLDVVFGVIFISL